MSIHILKHKLEERITGVALTESIFFRDFIDISCNQPKYFGQSIDISRNGSVVFSTTFSHRIDLNLSNVPIGTNYVIDIGRGGNDGVVTSSAFSINQPFFENLVVGDQVNQGDQIIIRWDYSGNIDNYELELSSNDIVISTDKSKLSSVNFSGGTDNKDIYSYNNVTKSQEFTWDVFYNDISSNREETKFYVILRDKDPSNNILVDSSANDITSAEFQIIAPVLKNLTVEDESGNIIYNKNATQGRHIKIKWDDPSGNIETITIDLSNNFIKKKLVNYYPIAKNEFLYFIPPGPTDISGSNFKILLNAQLGGFNYNIYDHVVRLESGTFDISFVNPVHLTYNASTLDLSRNNKNLWFRGVPSIPDTFYLFDEIDISWNETRQIKYNILKVGDDGVFELDIYDGLINGNYIKFYNKSNGNPKFEDAYKINIVDGEIKVEKNNGDFFTSEHDGLEHTYFEHDFNTIIDISGVNINYSKNLFNGSLSIKNRHSIKDISLNPSDSTDSTGRKFFEDYYVIDIDKGVFISPPFKINRPTIQNISFTRKQTTIEENLEILDVDINQGDQIKIKWDYSGNIKDFDIELSSNVINIPENFKLGQDNTINGKTRTFTWDVSYNDISSNDNVDEYFFIIIKDVDLINNTITDSSAVDLSSSKFGIIAPRLKKPLIYSPNIINQGRNITINWDYSGNINLFKLDLSNNTINYQSYTVIDISHNDNTFTLNEGHGLSSGDKIELITSIPFNNLQTGYIYDVDIDDDKKVTLKDNNVNINLDVSYNIVDISFNANTLELSGNMTLAGKPNGLVVGNKVSFHHIENDVVNNPSFNNQDLSRNEFYYIIGIIDDKKIKLSKTPNGDTIDISTNDTTGFPKTPYDTSYPIQGKDYFYIKKKIVKPFKVDELYFKQNKGPLYQSTNLKIQNIPNTGSNNKGSYTWLIPIDKDIIGTRFKIVLTPLQGGVIPIDISGIVGFIETGEFEIKFSKFFSLNVYGDDTNEKTIFEYKVISNDENQIELDTVQGLTVGDIIEYNNRGNTFISGDTLIGGLELTTYKIQSIDAKKIKLVSSDSVNVTQDTTIVFSNSPNFNHTLFTKSVTSNEYLLFYKRKNQIKFRISREAMSGYKFILHNVSTGIKHDMDNFGICNSVTVNPYIIEGNINWIFYEKMKLQGRIQKYDIPVENKWYITLTDLEDDDEFDISTNIFKIKYYGDCPTFPFGQFNNTKSNLKVYPFLDKGNTIQAKNPIFRSAIPLTRAQKLSYFTKNRYQNR
jgi:hypothetical protein